MYMTPAEPVEEFMAAPYRGKGEAFVVKFNRRVLHGYGDDSGGPRVLRPPWTLKLAWGAMVRMLLGKPA